MDPPSELVEASSAPEVVPDEAVDENNVPEEELPEEPGADSMSTSSSSTTENEDEGVSTEKAELLLMKATTLKEEGNKEFKDGDLDKASRLYRRAVNSLKKLNRNNTGNSQVKGLLLTLYTNLSTVSFKNKKYRVSSELAGQAIAIDPTAVKALYRRAVAYRAMGDLEMARADLKAAIATDPDNKALKKELAFIKKDLEVAKETQKKALAKAFVGGGGFLYNDKEEAEKRKAKEEKERQQREEEEMKRLKQLWEDECVARMAKGDEAISFDDWNNERKEKEEAERKKTQEERKEAARLRREAEKKAKKDESESDGEDEELTEAELQQLRGYKKTSDGRVTSYFTRELSEDEKKRIGDIAPKRLDSPVATVAQPTVASTSDASKWNIAQTWEERDCTTWCTSQLRRRLEETSLTEEAFDVEITSVDDLTGHASVAMVGGKKRYIFDFHVKLKFTVKEASNKELGKGKIDLPDICSGTVDEMEVDFAWKKRPAEPIMKSIQELLTSQLKTNVHGFVKDFNDMY